MASNISRTAAASGMQANVAQPTAAVAYAPAGVVTAPHTGIAPVDVSIPEAQVERVVGQARVDKSFLTTLSADTTSITSAIQQVSLLGQERVAEQQRALGLLAEASRLLAEAREREQAANAAVTASKTDLARIEADLVTSANDTIKAKEAQGAKARALAEIAAREAARAKASEAAALAAARLAAAEEAESRAQIQVAEARLRDSQTRKEKLLATAAESREESFTATRDAAQATALAEARQREIALAQQHVQAKLSELHQQQAALTPVESNTPMIALVPASTTHASPVDIPQPSQPALTKAAAISTETSAAASIGAVGLATQSVTEHALRQSDVTTAPVSSTSASSTGISQQSNTARCCGTDILFAPLNVYSWTSPMSSQFKYLLHIQFGKLEGLGATASRSLLLRARLGGIEARSQVIQYGTGSQPLNLEASIPVLDATDVLRVDVLDGSSASSAISKTSWDAYPSLGHVLVRIDKLTDGHVSKDNAMRLTPGAGVLRTLFHMEPYPASGIASSHTSGSYSWQRSGDFWQHASASMPRSDAQSKLAGTSQPGVIAARSAVQ